MPDQAQSCRGGGYAGEMVAKSKMTPGPRKAWVLSYVVFTSRPARRPQASVHPVAGNMRITRGLSVTPACKSHLLKGKSAFTLILTGTTTCQRTRYRIAPTSHTVHFSAGTTAHQTTSYRIIPTLRILSTA